MENPISFPLGFPIKFPGSNQFPLIEMHRKSRSHLAMGLMNCAGAPGRRSSRQGFLVTTYPPHEEVDSRNENHDLTYEDSWMII